MGKVFTAANNFVLDSLDNNRRLMLSPSVIGVSSALSIINVGESSGVPGFKIFTSNNKPSGSYVGDGDRLRVLDINTNGVALGGVMLITCEANNTCVIVTPNGSFVCDSGGVTYLLRTESVSFGGSSVVIYSNTGAFNAAGDTYEYFVL